MAGWSTPDATAADPSASVAPGDEPYVPPPGGAGWSTPRASASGGGWSTPGAAPAAATHKGGSVWGQLGAMVNPLNLVKGITHIAGEIGQDTGLTPSALLDTAKHVDPFYKSSDATKQKVSSPAANALFGNAAGPNKGEKGLHVFAQQSPTLYQAGRGLEHTLQGVPDIMNNEGQNLRSLIPGQPAGHGLANSIFGRDIHEQGVAPWMLQQVGNAAMLASGGASAGTALGFGNAAEAAGLEGLAARAVSNVGESGVGAINTAEKATAAAQAARAAGNASAAAEYESAAANLAKADAARAAVAARGGLGQAAEAATAGAKTVAHFGNQVAGAPAELYTKLVPKVANAATFGKAGELASSAAEAVRNSGVGQRLAAGKTMRELYRTGVTAEGERLAQPVNAATAQIKRLLPDEQDQMAAYLARSGDAATVLPHLATLPDAEIQAVIDRNPFLAQEGVTPAAVRKAADVAAGTLPAAEAAQFAQAHQLMEDSVYGPKEARHVAGYGDKAPMNPIKQAGREANVAGQPAPIAVGQLEDKLRAPVQKLLDYHQGKLDAAMQGGLSERPAPLSPSQERQAAVREGVTKTTSKLGTKRQGISTAARAAESDVRAQSLAGRRALADANREIAARSQRVSELQKRMTEIPEQAANHPSVQAPQVRSLLSHAKAVAESLRARAAELEATDPALAAQLRAAADAQPKVPADVAGQAKYIAGGEVQERPAGTGQGGPRIRSRQLTGSERARQTDVAPLTAEGQQAQVLSDIAGRPRNDLPRMVQKELGSTAGAVASEHGLEGEALAAHLKEQGYTAWDPEGSGGKLADHKVAADSPVLPTQILDKYQKWAPTKEPGALAKVGQTINKARIIKLLSTGFPLHKMGADMLLDMAVAGVNPFALGEGAVPGGSPLAQAVGHIREKNLPADVGVQQDRPIVPGGTAREKLANVPKHITQKGMFPFRMIDTANRDILYRTLTERGMSPQTAAEVTRQAAGDLQSMSPAEKAAGRAIVTYYPWQRHLADVAKNVVAGHPAGLAAAGAVAQADERAHPGQQERHGELADFMNPMGNFVLAPGGDVAGRVQAQLNPLLQLGAGALAGVNLRKGAPLTTPQHPFGATGPTGPLIKQPGNLAGFSLHTLVPQVGQIQDVLHGAKGSAGYIPYRQDTGQPESKKGSVVSQPGTTRLDAIARAIGFPHAEKAPAPKKVKRGR